jgi:drug/metabolite transporter superfamily protein YnfA
MIHLLTITLGLCLCYFALFFALPLFFEKEIVKISKKSVISISAIILFSLFVYYLNSVILDSEIANRVLHAFGGGFLAFMVCFLVVKDGRFPITKFQFIIFTVLFVTALGVANEIIEFFLQNYAGMVMANSINDTWLDLVSNLFGVIIAGIVFTPFVNISNKLDKVF